MNEDVLFQQCFRWQLAGERYSSLSGKIKHERENKEDDANSLGPRQ
jgi:hypothetical protein